MARKKTKRAEHKRAVIYARFSPRRRADECQSCEGQIEICRTYCNFHKLQIVGTYQDDNLSGATDDRPGLKSAIKKAAEQKAVLVVYSLSRLARNTRDTLEITEQLDKAGAGLASTKENFDTTGYMGRFILRLLAAMAEMEREQTSERTRDQMLTYQANGRRMSHLPPYGWRTDPDEPDRIVRDAYEQKVIKRVLALHKAGKGPRPIARQLEEEGYRPRQVEQRFKDRRVLTKGKRFYHTLIMSILDRANAR